MYEAVCAFYTEIGVPQENIAGSANIFVQWLDHSDELEDLHPDQVRYLARTNNNNIDSSKENRLIELAVAAIRDYGLQLYSQELLHEYSRLNYPHQKP